MVKLCGVSLLCALAVWILRAGKGDANLTAALSLGGTVLLWAGALQLLAPAVTLLRELGAESVSERELELLLRGLGLACIAQFAADFCRQSGESQLAAAVEWVGRAELLLLCLPLMRELLSLGENLLTGGN